MFPDVRLIIATTLASVLALICGFAMFAALGVSHQPIVALSPARAPLRPLADTIAVPPMTFAAAERRLPPREPQRPGETVASSTRLFEDRRGAEPVPAVAAAPAHHAIEAAETAAGATPKDAAGSPVAVANTPTAHDEAPAASPPEPAPRVVAATATPAPSIIVVEPPANLAPTIEPPMLQDEIAPAAVATMPAETLRKKEHNAKRRRVATPRRRARTVSGAVAEFTAPIANPNSSLAQPIFQTAPRSQQPQSAARPAHVRHGKIASRQAKPKTKELNAASGGPLVVAPMQ